MRSTPCDVRSKTCDGKWKPWTRGTVVYGDGMAELLNHRAAAEVVTITWAHGGKTQWRRPR